jgi:hypothetical protein
MQSSTKEINEVTQEVIEVSSFSASSSEASKWASSSQSSMEEFNEVTHDVNEVSSFSMLLTFRFSALSVKK